MSDPVISYPDASWYRDRHGKIRWRFRKGDTSVGLRGAPGDDGFDAAYLAAANGTPIRHNAPRARLAPRGIVYAIQGEPGTPVKIGFAVAGTLPRRIAVLQTGNPSVLRAIAEAPGFQRHERLAHVALANERGFGEWFSWSARTRAFVEALPAGIDAALDAVGRPSSSRPSCSRRTDLANHCLTLA